MKPIRISHLTPLLAAATAAFAFAPSHLAAQGTVVGGSQNAAPGGISVVVGGAKNRSFGGGSVVVGGNTNRANGQNSAIVTGFQNTTSAAANFSGIVAGSNNLVSGAASMIGSGNKNTASGLSTIVLGGTDNTCSGQFSVIAGGRNNTLAATESYLFGNDINYSAADSGILYLADNSRGGASLEEIFNPNTMLCRFDSGLLFFANPTSNSADFTISAAGNVGIKTPNPTVPLDITADGIGWRHSGTGASAGQSMASSFIGTQGRLGMQSNHDLNLITDGTTRMTITDAGRVGIGTSTPNAPLEVSGFTFISTPGTNRYFLNNSNSFGSDAPGFSTSIKAGSGIVSGAGFLATSDDRTKTIQGRSDGAADLDKLLGLEVTDYSFKDVVTKGNRTHKKVIAQQVEKIFPQAVITSTDVVPDIFKKASTADGWIKLATDLRPGDRVRLITKPGEQDLHEVLEVRDGAFRTAFKPAGKEVFVYGREVDDFRAVDYDAISMLNVSATQELARKLEAIARELEAKDAELVALHAKLAALEAREERLARLEQRLEDASRTVAVPVALSVSK